MLKVWRTLVGGVILVLCQGTVLLCQATDTIPHMRVEIEQTASNGAEARDLALSKGERVAFIKLLGQWGVSEASASQASDAQIHEWMIGFEVHKEQVLAQRYRASVSYHFDGEGLRTWVKTLEAQPSKPMSPQGEEKRDGPQEEGQDFIQQLETSLNEERSRAPLSVERATSEKAHGVRVKVMVSFQSLEQWAHLWREMSQMKVLKDVKILSFTPGQGVLGFMTRLKSEELEALMKKLSVCCDDRGAFSLDHPQPHIWWLRFSAS